MNHGSFRMRGYSGSKVYINYWFLDCWIWKPNFYYRLVDLEWFLLILDFWIRNAYFELRIDGSRMIFSIMDVLHLFILNWHYYSSTTGSINLKDYRMRQSENLPEAPIQKFTEFHNPKYRKKKCTIYRGTILFLHNLVGCREKNVGCRKKLPYLILLSNLIRSLF